MKSIRTVLKDAHSGESAWEAALVTFAVPDDIFDVMKSATHAVTFEPVFIYKLWEEGLLPLIDNTAACDAVIECFVATEPSNDELSEYPWSILNYDDDITFDKQTWLLEDRYGHSCAFFHID